jgi:plastocyanin
MRTTVMLGVGFALLTTAACGSSTNPASLCSSSGAAATVSATDGIVFSPASVTVTHGQSVCWQNVGTVPHTVSDNATGGAMFNGSLPAGQIFVRTFSTAGFFGYHCNIHSSMGPATITVN